MTLTTTPAPEISLRVGPLVNLPALLESQGYDPRLLFRECGFDVATFRDPENRLPFSRTSKLLAHCVHVSGVDHLGLLLGQMATASHLGLSGFLLQSAPTVAEALQSLVNNLDLHEQGGICLFDIGQQHSSLGYSLTQPDTEAVEQIYDLSGVMLYNIMRAMCGQDWTAESVGLERRHPMDLSPYQKFFNTRLYFNTTGSCITFDNKWLDEEPLKSDPLLFQHLTKEAEELHEAFRSGLIEKLPGHLNSALLTGRFSSADLASRLGIHERTLHRKLKSAGTSFRAELDSARRTLAKNLLGSTSLPVAEIASTLGYADSSSFIRAFQRWCNTSPSAWRKQHQMPQGPARHAG